MQSNLQPPPNPDNDAHKVRDTLMLLCPEPMRETFGIMVEMALGSVDTESLSALAADLQSTRDENGEIDLQKLIVIGKQFGLTDEMIAGYAVSFSAMNS